MAIAGLCRAGKNAGMDLKLREWRKARGLTLEQVAEELDTSAGQISRLETGERSLKTKWITGLARVYTCTPEELFAGPQFLDEQEKSIIDALRELEPGQRDAMERTIRSLATVGRGKSA